MCRMQSGREVHWEQVYETRATTEVSWFQADPATSVRLVEEVLQPGESVVDIGSGASTLVDRLLDYGVADITVLDVAERALDGVRERLGGRSAAGVTLVHADVLDWQPGRTFDVWHDRAVFHFLTGAQPRTRYVSLAMQAVRPGGTLILATFASDGPTHCSGLPVRGYDPDGLAAEFAAGFTLGHTEREEHRTPSGAVQPFTWVVLHRR